MTFTIPRRARIDLATPPEKAIRDALAAVEAAGADVALTDAVTLLGAALDRVADFVDKVPGKRMLPREYVEAEARVRPEPSDATCATCPFSEPMEGSQPPKVTCHNVVATAGEDACSRYADWWCSEHPARQRDRLAFDLAAGMAANPNAEGIAEDWIADRSYHLADALIARRKR